MFRQKFEIKHLLEVHSIQFDFFYLMNGQRSPPPQMRPSGPEKADFLQGILFGGRRIVMDRGVTRGAGDQRTFCPGTLGL